MIKKIGKVFLFSFLLFISYAKVYAVCPVCSIAVGAGVGFSRWIGVDDIITGIWVGALIVSMIMWTINWFNKKNIKFKFRGLFVVLFYYLIVLVPLFYSGIIGYLNPFFLFLDKLSLGVIMGSLVFWLSSFWYSYLKYKNGGHAHFPFQKVVMPVGALITLSLIIALLLKFN